MINQVVLVGSIESVTCDRNAQYYQLLVKVRRHYNDPSGNSIYDYIPVSLWRGAADFAAENDLSDVLVGIKGRVEKDRDGKFVVVAERVSYIHPQD